MASTLNITKQLTSDNKWQITATISPGGTLPIDIFIFENLGTTTLGGYVGVCDVDEYQRLQLFTGTAIPIFGNRFLRYTSAKILIDVSDDPVKVTDHIIASVKNLSIAFSNAVTTTTSVSIP